MTTYRLTLRCGPAATEPIIRLRHLLKTALRTHNMKCLDIETVDDKPREPNNEHLQKSSIQPTTK